MQKLSIFLKKRLLDNYSISTMSLFSYTEASFYWGSACLAEIHVISQPAFETIGIING